MQQFWAAEQRFQNDSPCHDPKTHSKWNCNNERINPEPHDSQTWTDTYSHEFNANWLGDQLTKTATNKNLKAVDFLPTEIILVAFRERKTQMYYKLLLCLKRYVYLLKTMGHVNPTKQSHDSRWWATTLGTDKYESHHYIAGWLHDKMQIISFAISKNIDNVTWGLYCETNKSSYFDRPYEIVGCCPLDAFEW